VTLKALKAGVDFNDKDALTEIARNCQIEFEAAGSVTLLDGEDVSARLRSPEVDKYVSTVSKIPSVREAIAPQQRRIAGDGGVVVEGRDVTTVVFQDADLKIFLSASIEERAKRRYKELLSVKQLVTLDEVVKEIKARDELDSSRAHSPLKIAADAKVIDTTNLTIPQVVAKIAKIIELVKRVGD
jgi:cytidylate kinase